MPNKRLLSSWLGKELKIFSQVSAVEKLTFSRHLSVMIKSGLSLTEALEISGQQTNNRYLQRVLNSVNADVSNGKSLHQAMSRFPRIFNRFYLDLIKVGEESGTLEKNLEYLSIYLQKSYEFRNRVRSALIYPGLVLTLSFGSATGLSVFVLPKMVDLFNSLDAKLPLSTRILIGVSTLLQKSGGYLGIGLILLIIFGWWLIHQPKIMPIWHRFLISLPVIGIFLRNIELASLFRNLGLMLKSGLPILSALDTQAATTRNLVYRSYITKLRNGIENGKSIGEIFMIGKFPFLPLIATKMLTVGEKSGRLDESLTYLGNFYDDEVDATAKNLTTILEPLVLVLVGLVVAFIAISIISPIYQFTSSIQR